MSIKRFMAVLLTTLMLLGCFLSNVSLAATSSSLKVFYSNNGAGSDCNQIYANIKLKNTGSSDIDLSKLTIRYYFTKDNDKAMTYYSDYVSIGSTSVTFNNYAPATDKADKYIEIKLSSGVIYPNGAQWPKQSEVTIQGRIAKNDWSNFNQSNDYSYTGASTQYVENSRIAVFESGVLIAGSVPGGSIVTNPPTTYAPKNTPTPSPTVTKAATPTKPAVTLAPTYTPTKSAATLAPTPTKPISTSSKGEVFVTVDKTKATVGEIIKATLNVKEFESVSGYQVNIKYDPSALRPVYLDGTPYDANSVPDYGTLLQKRYSGTDMGANDLTNGTLTFGRSYMAMVSYKNSGIPENTGSLAVIGFKVLKVAPTKIVLQNSQSLTNAVSGTMIFDWNGLQLSGYKVTQAEEINSDDDISTVTPTISESPTATPTDSVTPTPNATEVVSSKGEVFVTVDKTKAAIGEIIKATLNVKDFESVSGYQVNIKYDPAVLKPVYLDGTPYDDSSVPEYGTLLQKRYSGTDMTSNDLIKGTLTFGRTYMSLTAYKNSGTPETNGSLAVIGFKVLKVAATKIMLENTVSLTRAVDGTMIFDWDGQQLSGYTVIQAEEINYGEVSVATPTKPISSPTATPTIPVSSSKGQVYVTVDKTTATVGDVIKATLNVKDFESISGYQTNIKYDPAVLQPVYLDGTLYDSSSVPDYGTLLQKRYSGADMSSNDLAKGTLTFGRTYMSLTSYKNSGVPENTGSLAVIGFKVLKVAATKITLENSPSLTSAVVGTMVFDWNGQQLSGYTVTQAPEINSGSVSSPTKSVSPTPTLPAASPTPTAEPSAPTKGEVYVTVDKTKAAVGEMIKVTVNVKDFDVIAGYQANLKYDPAVLQPVYLDGTLYDANSVPDYGTLLQKRYSGTDMAANNLSIGTLTFGRTYMSMASYKNSGVPENTGSLAVIGFKVLKVATTKITLENTQSLTNAISGTMIFDWNGQQLSGYKVTQTSAIN
ncbi:MAG: cohesin domain-containing protein [Bacillota bacterium]|nr:cohesin domain-containing protein [Bacillota bacterium]